MILIIEDILVFNDEHHKIDIYSLLKYDINRKSPIEKQFLRYQLDLTPNFY